ncbi:hypothetical protein AMURIS_01332 [Acetatifactor muris]|uniref:Uncharacterized protein n=1 Tax=Acetatifactor muris TaxID=879566 RepID=A0A2K4ZDU0_9FIRM|nr:hypothetical protein AMURIS_01332 [Acetatifactor muris]
MWQGKPAEGYGKFNGRNNWEKRTIYDCEKVNPMIS